MSQLTPTKLSIPPGPKQDKLPLTDPVAAIMQAGHIVHTFGVFQRISVELSFFTDNRERTQDERFDVRKAVWVYVGSRSSE